MSKMIKNRSVKPYVDLMKLVKQTKITLIKTNFQISSYNRLREEIIKS